MKSIPLLQTIRSIVDQSRQMEEWEDSCWDVAAKLGKYPTGEGIIEAYWRTLVCNRENIDRVPSSDFEWAFKNWNTSFSQCNDESLLAFKQQSQSPEPGPPPTTIWERIQGFGNKWSANLQYAMLWAKVQQKLGLIKRLQRDAAPFEAAFQRYACGRKFCSTDAGYMGWVPMAAQSGDLLCYFEDCQLPFVIRRCEGGYLLVGDAYLHGLMHARPVAALPFFSKLEKIILI